MEAVIIALIGAISASIVSPVVAFFLAKTKSSNEQSVLLCQGMRALLWREIKEVYAYAIANDGLTTDERDHLENVYAAYHGIGGNGTGTRLYEDAMKTPVKERV